MKFVISLFATITVLLLASLFGTVNAGEVHQNGFGGITPLNTTGLAVFNDSLKRSFDYESDSLVLSAEFSILETNGDIRDFSLFDNDLTTQNSTGSTTPIFIDGTFRTSLETSNVVGNDTFTPTDDTYARQDNPDTVYGTQTVVNIASYNTGTLNRRVFVEFDISSIPAGVTITLATMEMYATTWGGTFPRNYDAQRVIASWDESTLTWNNQPSTSGTNYTDIVQGQSGLDIWTITDIVEGWYNGTFTNYGVRVRDDTEDNSGATIFKTYYSKEFGVPSPPPLLRVSWSFLNQWANASHSETLDMENTNVSLVWWGQIRQLGGVQYITGKGCSAGPYVYGIYLDAENEISAMVEESGCVAGGQIESDLPSGGLSLNQTYGIGVVFEDNPWGADVHFWLDGEWIYNETSTERVGDTDSDYYVGRSTGDLSACNCTHDEVLVFKERLTNDTMKLLTTKQHDIVIRSGPATTTQGFEGLFFALPWLIVFGLLGWLFYVVFLAWKEPFTRD